MALLDRIVKKNDIKNIDKSDYERLAYEIRQFLVDKVSRQGGHLASNLGCVELTMALHIVMNFPEDKLIFDVGHQAYTHKLLTGRKDDFNTLRAYGGMSGFPKTRESECDVFNTGHSSTSISAAMGFAVARDLKGGNEKVAAVIGDGSLTGGMAYEALNCLAQAKTGCVIVLNDNEMSIDKNVGGLSKYLNSIRVGTAYNELKVGVENSLLGTKAGEKVAKTIKRSKDTIKQFFVPGMFFEELGITYVGPVDGHNINEMVYTFKKAFKLNKPIIIHVKTKKGMGYRHAERHPDYFHGIAAFDSLTGRLLVKKECKSYTDIFAKHMVTMGEQYDNLVAVTAAMSIGTGLNKFQEQFPNRMFDVGIAEQHAVTFAAGLAAAGMIPFVAIYSSFLQRAYDQILHDVCLQKLHVIFAVDRSGLVGQDGETHQGIYDISYLSHMPGMTVMAPKNRYELESMMEFAVAYDGPVAIKYPRGDAYKGLKEYALPIEYGKSEVIFEGSQVAIFACGNMVEEAVKLTDMLKEEGVKPTLVNVRFVSQVDHELLEDICSKHSIIVTMEENIIKGGYGELVDACISDKGIKKAKDFVHINCGIDKGYVEQGSIKRLREELGIDAKSVFEKIKKQL
ncbi:MAG: 1-deoxy-D-xylulose-5-phosphate synthase [Lachnospiraceae bacterium]|nr:1-deoxy-D-xylulose-5-phosphate synthase [Lachnospiraceae bacterium]